MKLVNFSFDTIYKANFSFASVRGRFAGVVLFFVVGTLDIRIGTGSRDVFSCGSEAS